MTTRLPRRARAAHRRPAVGAVLAALVLVMTVAACDGSPPPPENPPYWHPGTVVTATNHGPLVRIKWSATTGGDPVGSYQITLGSYTGTVVALVPASVRDCYITGLAANTSYSIVVTARDAQQHWSGPLPGTQGNRTTAITTTGHGGSGNLWCHAPTDTDDDGVPNALETNDGTYTSASDVGTDPANPDTDNDGIPDGEEALGIAGLNLRTMGAKPTHKDLFVELDWLDDLACPGGHRPGPNAIALLVDAFADAPILNPDGTTGIRVFADYGQGGAFTGGNVIPDADGRLDNSTGVNSAQFLATKGTHTDPARLGVFQYGLVGLGTPIAEGWGNDFRAGDGCGDNDTISFAGTVMHEIGHNLSLEHGGATPYVTRKPNYSSVMTYDYQRDGLDTDCDRWGDETVIGYSSGTNPTLDETDLDETVGLCNGVDIDWNYDGVIETSVAYDVNQDGDVNEFYGGAVWGPLKDHNDWALVDSRGLRCVRARPDLDPPRCPNSLD